ncbi:methionyl-tRNA formyltransferase [Thiotrichales bacterium 19S3-7]|nr:methionyl-tRNA formyltransferase [Thiotrichales bacterium 19S3-7]MCF6801240.1 methionyl-tRNA formyltransferase [Thiotrichales bacterium 19S3-11]
MNHNKLSVVFAGTPEIAATVLSDLIHSDTVNITAALTQPDRASGRGKKVQESPVKTIAAANSINIIQPTSFKKEPQTIEMLKSLKPDLMIVIAYGLILPKAVLDIPKYGCINIHVSLLPKWRGAAPIQRAIEAGDKTTGISIMQMDLGLDTGDILNTTSCEILANDTAQSLHDKLAKLAAPVLIKTINQIQTGLLSPTKQDNSQATYAEKISKVEGSINWHLSALEIERKIRAFTPWPGSYTLIDGETVKIFDAYVINTTHHYQPGSVINLSKKDIQIATGDGILAITKLQFPGKKPMPIADVINGKSLTHLIGTVIGV